MLIHQESHLTYCTNIHTGESWEEVFNSIKKYILPIKQNISSDKPFGIGLRLSDEASKTLIDPTTLQNFKWWLDQNELYVFTMNGFPFGGFHDTEVKDNVHKPDWTSQSRLAYTIRLCNILAYLLPEGLDGGISTSPISYKPWFKNDNQRIHNTFKDACKNILEVIQVLYLIKLETGKTIHIDIEPEPDGLIENTYETIHFFKQYLIPLGINYFRNKHNIRELKAEEIIKTHVQVCYDVCHFAIEYEEPKLVFEQLKKEGIKIGKIQISAALKADLSKPRDLIAQQLSPFIESTYLHQVIARDANNALTHYTDLSLAMDNLSHTHDIEWRTHFHVPIFIASFHLLESTQDEIVKVLNYQKENSVTHHLEIETYTWEVLPEELKMPLLDSIDRELKWVIAQFN